MLLGIDIGTSKVAAVIVSPSGEAAAVSSHAHSPTWPRHRAGRAGPRILLEAVLREVESLPGEMRSRVAPSA